MSIGHCSCPDCGTTLRIRDRSFVGRTVPCPDCRTALVIELDHDGHVAARRPVIDKTAAPTKASSSSLPVASTADPVTLNSPRTASRWGKAFRRACRSPLMMAWALALAMTALVVVAMTRPSVRFRSGNVLAPGPSTQPEAATDNPLAPGESPSKPPHSGRDPNGNAPLETPPPRESLSLPAADATRPGNAAALTPEHTAPVVEPAIAVAQPNPVFPTAAPPPKIDFDVLLKQRLKSFEQSVPVSRRALIEFLEELLGAPVRYNAEELGEQHLNKLVTVRRLENTTLSAIFKSVLDPAGWEFVTDESALRIRPKPSGDTPPKS